MISQFFDSLVLIMRDVHQIDISKFNDAFLEKTITKRMEKLGLEEGKRYSDLLCSSSQEAHLLSMALQNHYSVFFRDMEMFSLFHTELIPRIFKSKVNGNSSEIRFWSMACAGGQEAYSIAMLIEERAKKYGLDWPYRVFASDISGFCINHAMKGLFTSADLQHVTLARMESFFTKKDGLYEIVPSLRKHTQFSCYDLLDAFTIAPPDCIFGSFDVIFCCNVLYYYKSYYQKIIVDKISKSLNKQGYLITDKAEKEIVSNFSTLQSLFSSYPVFIKT